MGTYLTFHRGPVVVNNVRTPALNRASLSYNSGKYRQKQTSLNHAHYTSQSTEPASCKWRLHDGGVADGTGLCEWIVLKCTYKPGSCPCRDSARLKWQSKHLTPTFKVPRSQLLLEAVSCVSPAKLAAEHCLRLSSDKCSDTKWIRLSRGFPFLGLSLAWPYSCRARRHVWHRAT